MGRVGATFPGGLSLSRVAWFGSGGFSMRAGMTVERRRMKGGLQSPALGRGFLCSPGGAGITEPGLWGQASLLSGAGLNLPLG